MLTKDRMIIAREVLEALREVDIDLAGDAMAREEHEEAANCLLEAGLIKRMLKALDNHASYDDMEVPNFLRHQAD